MFEKRRSKWVLFKTVKKSGSARRKGAQVKKRSAKDERNNRRPRRQSRAVRLDAVGKKDEQQGGRSAKRASKMERRTGRLTEIYILSSAICVSELCRVTVVRRIRSGKSVIITRATVSSLSFFLPPFRVRELLLLRLQGCQNPSFSTFPALFSPLSSFPRFHLAMRWRRVLFSRSARTRNKQVNTAQKMPAAVTAYQIFSHIARAPAPYDKNEIIVFLYVLAFQFRVCSSVFAGSCAANAPRFFLLSNNWLFHMFCGLIFGQNYTQNVLSPVYYFRLPPFF